ncbi:TetR family transcriptional regulator C-terminal domain-containing protein [Bradyrhizobium japonicum]|uniref:TetR family transcriptional regulator C-terminal domain-containing protein n=1 Tax=Bradyrhizobium japonicum TaxID=375 RepID=UPI003F67AAAA
MAANFDSLAEWFERPDFHGCAFIKCAAEFPYPKHPIRSAAREHKEALQAAIAEICRKAAGIDREVSAAIYLLVEGAIVAAFVNGDRARARTALDLESVRHPKTLG